MTKNPSRGVVNIFIDISHDSFCAASGNDVFSFPIERQGNGRLTGSCRERLVPALKSFLSRSGRVAGQRALCAIGARGVSLRRLTLPAAPADELQRMLRLQLESEFPISPDELAWGSQRVGKSESGVAALRVPAGANGGAARQELLVVAVKKDALDEYAGILSACGLIPSFTLGAFARAELYPLPNGPCAVLDVGRTQSELISFDRGAPLSVRVVAWGGDNEAALASLAPRVKSALPSGKLYLTGQAAGNARLASKLAGLLGGAVSCESLDPPADAVPSPAIAGLKKSKARDAGAPLLTLELTETQSAAKPVRSTAWLWAAAAVALVLAALFFPYAEAIVLKPVLEKRLVALEADRGRLAVIDQELDFLKFLKQNQPPYLDTIYLLAKSAAQGSRLESLSMGRHQQISMQLKMGNAQDVSDFRGKLIDSGWFANVIVEEQTPSPDRRVTVRMTADLKPTESRKPIAAEATDKKEKAPIIYREPEVIPPPMPMMPPPGPAAAPSAPKPGPPPGIPDGGPPRRIRRLPPGMPQNL